MEDEEIVMNKSECEQNRPTKKKKLKKAMLVQRSEASQNISEFHLTEVGKEKVKLIELISTSQRLAGQELVKKQLEKARKLKSISVPLSKPQLQKIKRTVAYEKVCGEITKWEPVVQSNRAADQIVYPLKKPELRLETFEKVAENYVTKHPVEIAVTELLKKSESTFDKTTFLTAAEEKALKAMSPEEAALRHNELMKHRALISFKEIKARRQNKIKSKRYHRILKKEKLKKAMKEFEALKDVDKEAALEKLMEADKIRVLERMTLKHRNTGKWAKQQKLRAKYNPESRSVLKEELAIGRQLREKAVDEEAIRRLKNSSNSLETPEIDESNFSIFNRGLIEEAGANEINIFNETDALVPFSEIEAEQVPEQSDVTIPTVGNPDSLFNEFSVENLWRKKESKKSSKNSIKNNKPQVSDVIKFADARDLGSLVPDGITLGDEELDDTPDGTINIHEAFADEDLIAEFSEDKKASDRANQPEGIDLFLPGWGAWAGPRIKANKRKRRRFFIKPVVVEAPKKSTLGNVILNEDKDKKASVHQVSELPFPFSNVHQFESYIRQPIGHTWNPQSSFQSLIAPKVITKIGKIIEPMDAEDAVLESNKQSQEKQPPTRKRVRKGKGVRMPEAF